MSNFEDVKHSNLWVKFYLEEGMWEWFTWRRGCGSGLLGGGDVGVVYFCSACLLVPFKLCNEREALLIYVLATVMVKLQA